MWWEAAPTRFVCMFGLLRIISSHKDPAAGGSDDWTKSKAGVKYVYLLELRPDDSRKNKLNALTIALTFTQTGTVSFWKNRNYDQWAARHGTQARLSSTLS